MPRPPEEILDKVLAVVQKSASVTSTDVALALGIPARSARRHLAVLFARRSVNREAGYTPGQEKKKGVVFHYRYTARHNNYT